MNSCPKMFIINTFVNSACLYIHTCIHTCMYTYMYTHTYNSFEKLSRIIICILFYNLFFSSNMVLSIDLSNLFFFCNFYFEIVVDSHAVDFCMPFTLYVISCVTSPISQSGQSTLVQSIDLISDFSSLPCTRMFMSVCVCVYLCFFKNSLNSCV